MDNLISAIFDKIFAIEFTNMKKVIIGLSGLIVLTFFIIFAVDAQNNNKEVSKANTEISKDFSQCSSVATCPGFSSSKSAACNSSKCSAMNCGAAKCNGCKCDPATCKVGKCDPLTCKTNCKFASSEVKCGPMNCNR